MQVSWSVELEIRPGCLDDFEELTVKWWLRLVQKAVFWATNDSSVTTDKRFTGKNVTKAPRQRLLIFANSLRPSASALFSHGRAEALCRDPSDELRALLGIYRATYHRPFGSFAYWG